MKASTERLLQRRLADDAQWANTPVGRLARLMVDNNVPVPPVAAYLGVAGIVLRRWLYGYKGETYTPGGRLDRKAELYRRIDTLIRIIDAARWRDRLKAPWAENFARVESDIEHRSE